MIEKFKLLPTNLQGAIITLLIVGLANLANYDERYQGLILVKLLLGSLGLFSIAYMIISRKRQVTKIVFFLSIALAITYVDGDLIWSIEEGIPIGFSSSSIKNGYVSAFGINFIYLIIGWLIWSEKEWLNGIEKEEKKAQEAE